MANYHIIGGDTKEYGPIPAEDVRLWIREGRLNAQSLAKGDGGTAWRTLASFPEFAAELNAAPPAIAPPSPGFSTATPASPDFLGRDYELDIGGCVTRSWELVKNNFGTLFGGFLAAMALIAVASMIVNGLASLVLPANEVLRAAVHLGCIALVAPVAGPLTAGLYFLFIRTSRGETTSAGDIFLGFQKNPKALILGYLTVAVVGGLCLAPYSMVSDAKLLPITEQMRHAAPADLQSLMPQFWSALFSTLPVLLICMIPVTYLAVNWQFTLPLIIDKQMAFWPAMKTSWKMVHKHWWQVFGLTIVVGLVSVAGILGCCIGIIFTIPIAMGAMMIAYETIFGPRKLSHTKARNAALMNLLGTPGLGSLMAGRWLAGSLQLFLSLVGFILVCVWFYKLVIIQFYGQIDGNVTVKPVWKIGATGAVLFAAAWLWSLVTSLSLLQAAKQKSTDTLKAPYLRATKLDQAGIQAALAALPEWQRTGDIIARTYQFRDFPAAMKFVNAIAEAAEAAQHHPDVDIRWNKVTLALTTHDAGGLTEKDFTLARLCDGLMAG